MQRTRFKNKLLKNPTNENRYIYIKIRNLCVSLLRKEKKNYFTNLNDKDITDNRKFWNTVKPLFTEKNKSRESIVLIEKGKTIFKEDEVASTLNNFFSNIVKSINIPEHHKCTSP